MLRVGKIMTTIFQLWPLRGSDRGLIASLHRSPSRWQSSSKQLELEGVNAQECTRRGSVSRFLLHKERHIETLGKDQSLQR